MRTLFFIVLIPLFSSCDKDEGVVLKEKLTISIHNKTESDYTKAKLYSGSNVTTGYEIADSIEFNLLATSDTTINWKPKVLLKGEGTFQLYLSKDKKENFGYVVGKKNADGYKYEISILENSVDIIAK